MTPYTPPGYIALADIEGDRTALRARLASGELEAFVPDVTGDLIPIMRKYWRVDSCQRWLDTGMFYDDQWRKDFPIWIKMPTPAASVAEAPDSSPRGPKPKKRDEVMQKMRSHGLADVFRMTEDEMESRFGASRRTCRDARNLLKVEKPGK
jgi:hypothetical protein